ncbi:pteridine reductase [Ferrimonas gelatinilytica]|uniref:Pteridine reductase n=1 Tax=Ferrimonas gelatinilytica TaxID=1255257 RepID=A0ABP9RVE9_9GAMM
MTEAKQEKVALVTGSARRVGAAINRTLHRRGYRLLIHCNQSVDEAQLLAAEFNQVRPGSARVLIADLCQPEQVRRLASEACDAWQRLDLLVNNASSFFPTPVGEIDHSAWDALVGPNMYAPLIMSQQLMAPLRQQQGAIINLLDVHAQSPLKGHTLYCMAKAALSMMTRSLALELAPQVRVNAVSPGAILWPSQGVDVDAQQRVLSQIPLQRLGSVDEIAEAVAFLADEGRYITGQILAVDGGRSLSPLAGA